MPRAYARGYPRLIFLQNSTPSSHVGVEGRVGWRAQKKMLCEQKSNFRAFFRALLSDESRRKPILLNWHRDFPVDSADTCVKDMFKRFICTLLYEPARLRLTNDGVFILGSALPIRKEWLSHAERGFLNAAFDARERLFMERKEYPNEMYEYAGFVFDDDGANTKPYECLVDTAWRRQLLRDFMLYLVATKSARAHLCSFLLAVQSVLLTNEGRTDVFLAGMHGALQGRYPIVDIPCWGLSASDMHSNEVLERDNRARALLKRRQQPHP